MSPNNLPNPTSYGEEWHFTFEEYKNEKIKVKDNSAVVFCNEYDVDAFNFEFFNLIPVTI